jgi:hypothetical protein
MPSATPATRGGSPCRDHDPITDPASAWVHLAPHPESATYLRNPKPSDSSGAQSHAPAHQLRSLNQVQTQKGLATRVLFLCRVPVVTAITCLSSSLSALFPVRRGPGVRFKVHDKYPVSKQVRFKAIGQYSHSPAFMVLSRKVSATGEGVRITVRSRARPARSRSSPTCRRRAETSACSAR